jgi:hypothetical protein
LLSPLTAVYSELLSAELSQLYGEKVLRRRPSARDILDMKMERIIPSEIVGLFALLGTVNQKLDHLQVVADVDVLPGS